MEDILRFLQSNESWIYLILGGAGLVYLRKLMLSYREWKAAVFGLEQDNARRRFSSAMTILGLLCFIGAGVFTLTSFVAPAMPHSMVLSTPTIDLLATATATLPVVQVTPLAGIPQVETPAAGTPSAAPTIPAAGGCIAGQIEWTFPSAGDEVSGLIELKGTVQVQNFGFYKYEYSQPGVENWVTIAAGNQPRQDQPLGGVWNTRQLVPGDYLLRLVVADNANQQLAPCVITIRVVTP